MSKEGKSGSFLWQLAVSNARGSRLRANLASAGSMEMKWENQGAGLHVRHLRDLAGREKLVDVMVDVPNLSA